MPANGTFFVTYEVVQEYLSKFSGSNETTMLASITAGGLAGMSYWILGMPADVLKSRLQTGLFNLLINQKKLHIHRKLISLHLPTHFIISIDTTKSLKFAIKSDLNTNTFAYI